MKTFIADIIPKIQRFSQQLDNITLLTNQHWVVIDGIQEGKSVYIFRPNGELIMSTNGRVEKAKWELLGQNSILVDMKNESYLFKHGFFDENVLALKIDGREEYAFLLNENRYSGELNTVEQVVDFLSSSYLSKDAMKLLNPEVETKPLKVEPNRITSFEKVIDLTDDNKLQIVKDLGYSGGTEVRVNGGIPKNGFYWREDHMVVFEIINGTMNMEYYIETFKQSDGKIVQVGANRINGIQRKSPVWIDQKPAPDGVYSTGMFSTIKVFDGRID